MELGPIRPPSEAESLMLRVTRGCHWNKCYFCDLYKKYKFSRRRYEEIEEDLKKAADSEYAQNYTTCFLQDGDAFVLRTEFLMQILEGIHKYLPNIKHVTTYARADSIARKSVSELRELKTAGIEHLYCGMETGSDLILRKINKGFDAATIIISGTKAKEAGMVLSEFTLFGIGGKELAEENAVETAKVLNVIKPDYAGRNPLEVLKHYGAAYITAVGTMSSAATLAVALRCARKSKVLRNDMIDFGIPLFANIHLCGSVLTETFFVMVVSKILYGDIPDMKMMVLFCILLGIFAIGAPGVPGGTVMASLGLITGILGFNETGTALILTVFALQDSFGTACNITGDGALTLILTGYANRHGISEKTVKNSDC